MVNKGRYVYIGDGWWRCRLCGRKVRELGWFGHNRWHRKRSNRTQTKLAGG